MEELDRVARRILEEDLLAADTDDDVVAEPGSVIPQAGDGCFRDPAS